MNAAHQPKSQKPIVVYTTAYCPYCVRAKTLLKKKGFDFREIDVSDDPAKREWLVQRTGRRTVPQIFIGDEAVGGFDDIADLDRRGALDAMVRGG